MALEKTEAVDRIEVVHGGYVQVRTKITSIKNGNPVDITFHRHVIAPGDDYSKEDDRVQAVCANTHTTELIESHQAAKAAQGV